MNVAHDGHIFSAFCGAPCKVVMVYVAYFMTLSSYTIGCSKQKDGGIINSAGKNGCDLTEALSRYLKDINSRELRYHFILTAEN